jgi:tryptophan-rich sensory protein
MGLNEINAILFLKKKKKKKMSWSPFHAVELVAWTVFVFWEPFQMKEKDREYYDKHSNNLQWIARVPAFVFPIVWTLLKTLNVTAIVVYSDNIISESHWAWPTVFALFFAGQILAKIWTMTFFRFRLPRVALVLSIVLFALAVATIACMGASTDNSNLWGLSLGLLVPHCLWLAFAIALNASWVMMKHDPAAAADGRTAALLSKASIGASINPLLGNSKINHKIVKGT